ncbi:MAG: hypothetical protein P8L71_00755 [Flavobacteriales bacterium]|nr:hypothetical protein [Flavobacteriales bacterium]
MKTLYTFVVFLMSACLFLGCVAPTNLNYDSARMLSTKDVDGSASYSNYLLYTTDSTSSAVQQNVSAAVHYGVSEQYNVSLKFENATGEYSIDSELISFEGTVGYNYFELNNKIGLLKDKIALSLPLGAYQFRGNENVSDFVYVFDPRLLLTIPLKEEKFNLTITPKAHFFIGDVFVGWPGLTIGSEMSSDLSRWAIHPSIGFDGYLSAGIGFRYGIIRN